jgi:hypothetical protein
MPKIYDNIVNQLVTGLKATLSVSYHSDFCVGYFNLRGWKEVSEEIDFFYLFLSSLFDTDFYADYLQCTGKHLGLQLIKFRI